MLMVWWLLNAIGILSLRVSVCVYVGVLRVVHAYNNTVVCVGGVCWLKLHAHTCLVGM